MNPMLLPGLLGLLLASLLSGQAMAMEPLELGRRIYQEGRRADGTPLSAVVQGDIPLTGTQMNCMSCHRRSGMGSFEGGAVTLPVTGDILYRPREKGRWQLNHSRLLGSLPRPAYDDASLARAIRDGVDPAGRRLEALMPRYPLDDTELAALTIYLKSLNAFDDPGVDHATIHFATVLAGPVAPDRRQALQAVIQAFLRDKNSGARFEHGTARFPRWHRERKYRAYRRWEVHTWTLQGDPESWQAQLAAYYREQPVFAVLGGLADGAWQPVHDFCEATGVPCLFPSTDLPGQGESHYNLYFSRGMALEARALARHLRQRQSPGPILQLYRDNPESRAAARAFREAMDGAALRELSIDAPPTAAQWNTWLGGAPATTLVLWLPAEDLVNLPARTVAPDTGRLFLSGTLAPPASLAGLAGRERLHLVYPFVLEEDRAQGTRRTRAWVRGKGITPRDLRTEADTLFALTAANVALKHMIDHFSRDYFIERLEHYAEYALSPSMYPRLSLGPGQRFAAKGAWIVALAGNAGQILESHGEWIVP